MAQPVSTFNTALPYGIATLAVGVAGLAVAVTATSTAAIVAAAIFATMGAYGFIGVVGCGIMYSGDPQGFKDNVGKAMVTMAGTALTQIITNVAQALIFDAIFGGRSRRAY